MDSDTTFISDKEIASELRMSLSWVRKQRWLRRHEKEHVFTVDPVMIGSVPRYRNDDVQAWIEALNGPRDVDKEIGLDDEKNDFIEASIDGSCLVNPGPGGWGVDAVMDGEKFSWSGGVLKSTNNKMELIAAINALELLPADRPLVITTDSQYVQKGITEWITNWKCNGWRTANRKLVANQDLWEALDAITNERKIDWQWIRGHASNPGNERAHALAQQAARKASIRRR